MYHKAAPADLQRVEAEWPAIIGMVDGEIARQTLKTAERKFDAADPAEDVLYIICRGVVGADYFKEAGTAAVLEELIEERIGKRIHVRIMDEAQEQRGTGQMLTGIRDALQKKLGIPIETVPDG